MAQPATGRWLVAAVLVAAIGLVLLLRLGGAPGPDPVGDPQSDPAGATAAAASGQVPPRGHEAPADDGIPHTELPLRLLATVVRDDRSRSLAAVEDEEEGGHQILTEGVAFAHHPDARLARIERSRILIDNAGRREQLVFDRTAVAPTASSPLEPSSEELERRRAMSRRLRDLVDAGEDYRDPEGEERSGLLAEGEVEPVYVDGELVGVGIEAVRAGGLYDTLGLRNGDVVTSVNGVALGGPAAAAELLAELALADVLELAVDRSDGTTAVLAVDTAELIAGIDALE